MKACVDHPRGGPKEDASVANSRAGVKLTERRVVRGGWYAENHLPFTVERGTSRRSTFCQMAGIEWKAMGNLD